MTPAADLDGVAVRDVAARATGWGGLLFVPAPIWTPDGWGDGVPPERLDDYTTAYLPLGAEPDGNNSLEYTNALWVRARLPVAMGFAPPTCRRPVRWQFLDVGLLAVEDGGRAVTPFVCTDRDLQAELRYGPGCPAERRRAIAAAFWGLLAAAPATRANYRDRFMFSDGHDTNPTTAGFWRGRFWMLCRRW